MQERSREPAAFNPGTVGGAARRIAGRGHQGSMMTARATLLLAALASLAGCTNVRVPSFDMSGLTLPEFEIFRYGTAETVVPTTPYRLTPGQLNDIRAQFTVAPSFQENMQFGPIAARQRKDGSLAVCGLVNVRRPDGGYLGMRLFDGDATPAPTPETRTAFTLKRIAGFNAKSLDIYIACRDAGVL